MIRVLLLLALVTSLVLNEVLFLRHVWRENSRARRLLVRVSVSGFALTYLFLALEVGTFAFLVQSDSFGYTLASKRWFDRYWQPINAAGFRDEEHSPQDLGNRRLVLAVGDSFVAGHGIADPADRFPDVLGTLLGPDWLVVQAARNGWHTADELEAIRGFAPAPEVIVLSYYLNDVERAALEHGLEPPEPFAPPPAWFRPVVERSYFVNFAYWRLYRFLRGDEIDRAAFEYHEALVTREDVWRAHREELLEIVRIAEERGSRLLVVVFPNLRAIERSRPLTARVVELMEGEGVATIDLTTLLADRDPAELIVNRLDNHPGVALHREIAELLHARVEDR